MTDTKAIAHQSFRLIENADAELAQRIIAPDFVNDEADDDPDELERRLLGPAGFLATSRWLRDAFSNLRFELQETVAEGATVMASAIMTGQHTGLFNGIAPAGGSITQKQVHIFTITDCQISRHRAVRDDLGLLQLGAKLISNARDAAATSSSSQDGIGSSLV
jgi:predicted ester cyclase